MKLLLDQNISFRVIRKIIDDYPDAQQVRRLRLENSSDLEIWEFAKSNDFAVVTFDSDFIDIANIKGHPPKIIWLRTGNMTTNNIARILIEWKSEIEFFLEDESNAELAVLEIE